MATHGVRHGAAHLRLRNSIDLRRVDPGFPPEVEMPEGTNVEQVIAGFSGFANAIVAAVNVEQVIEDTPCRGEDRQPAL